MSKMTREDMLRELELLPVWQLRVPLKTMNSPQLLVEESPVVADTLVSDAQLAAEPVSPPASFASIDTSVVDVEQKTNEADTSFARGEQIAQMDWQSLQQCVRDCQACGLAQGRTQTVFGAGDAQAEWMFIGEAPSAEDDSQGAPFVGQAGKLLDNMLAALRLKRGENVYITHLLKCSLPENRESHYTEAAQCECYLNRQIELVQPKLIVVFGKAAAQTLLKSADDLDSMRGQLHEYHEVPVVVTYHPAHLLASSMDKAKAWEDLCFAKDTLQNL